MANPLVELTAEIVISHASSAALTKDELLETIKEVYSTLRRWKRVVRPAWPSRKQPPWEKERGDDREPKLQRRSRRSRKSLRNRRKLLHPQCRHCRLRRLSSRMRWDA